MPIPAAATPLGPDARAAIDTVVRQTLEGGGAPSASIAIASGGQIGFATAYGLAGLSPAKAGAIGTR
jgi:CubicO group peptidase (beta-lactamase class C family)